MAQWNVGAATPITMTPALPADGAIAKGSDSLAANQQDHGIEVAFTPGASAGSVTLLLATGNAANIGDNVQPGAIPVRTIQTTGVAEAHAISLASVKAAFGGFMPDAYEVYVLNSSGSALTALTVNRKAGQTT